MKIRHLSLSDKVTLFFNHYYAFTGVVFFIMSLVFLHFFEFADSVKNINFSLQKVYTTEGFIEEVYETNLTVNKKEVNAFKFSYVVEGQTLHNTSFSQHYGANLKDTETIVEYVGSKPEISRIKGMRASKSPLFALLFIMIFSCIGLGMLVMAFQDARKKIRIISNGTGTRGRLLSSTKTSVSINKRPVYKMKFEFEANGQTYNNTTKTVNPENLKDEKEEKLIYNRSNPAESVMLDTLPGQFKNWF
jgi:hypothetical protein